MKKENIVPVLLALGLIGVGAYSFVQINKLKKELADVKSGKADKTKLSNIADKVKNVGDDVNQILNRVKTNM